MKKKYIIAALILISLLTACKNNQVVDKQDTALQGEKTQSTLTNSKADKKNSDKNDNEKKSNTAQTQVKPLAKDDFIVEYKGVQIAIGEPAGSIFKTLGDGDANESNNYGFIGWDAENKYKFFNHGYPAESPVIEMNTKLNIADNTSIVHQVDLLELPTKRGVKKGDPYSAIEQLYGKPQQQEKTEDGTNYIYTFDKKQLCFYFGENKTLKKVSIIDEN